MIDYAHDPDDEQVKMITAAKKTAKPWTMTEAQYQAAQGVKQPWIAEISPFQYSRLSKRQKAAYDERRRQEWQASADCKKAYRAAVVAAHDAGLFDLDDLHVSRDARHAVIRAKIEADQAARAARFAQAERANRITTAADLRPGDRVYVLLASSYATVRKVRNRSVSVELPGVGRPWTVTLRGLHWLSYDDLKRAAEEGRSIGPQRDALAA